MKDLQVFKKQRYNVIRCLPRPFFRVRRWHFEPSSNLDLACETRFQRFDGAPSSGGSSGNWHLLKMCIKLAGRNVVLQSA